jgi:hypothetical protein
MSHWVPTRLGLMLLAGIVLLPSPVQVQTPDVKRTAGGDPDLQGIWVINEDTPLERPDPKLDAARLAALAKWFPGGESEFGGVGGGNKPLRTIKPGQRTALVVDPPTGRIPMKPAAEAKRDYKLAHLTDSYETHTLWERCITRGPILLPAHYNNGYEILQVPGYVVFRHEMIHEYRVIPLDGRSRLPGTVRQWMGEGRGRWEGNTLVIETTNFREGTIIASSTKSLGLRGLPHSEALRTVERLTLANPDLLKYELLVEDPNTYTQPWKVAFSINREQQYQIFEYACHEGNYPLMNTLKGARAEEAAKK